MTRSLLHEKNTPPEITIENLKSLLDKKVLGLTYDMLKNMLKINGRGFLACAKKIHYLLLRGDYIDERYKATKKFLTDTTKDFELEGVSKKHSETILKILNHFRSSYLCSTFVPHMEIIRTWFDLREKFAICEIFAENDDTPPNEFHQLYFNSGTQPISLNNSTSLQTQSHPNELPQNDMISQEPGTSSGISFTNVIDLNKKDDSDTD